MYIAHIVKLTANYTVSQKHPGHFRLSLENQLPDFDNFGTTIPDTTCHQMIIQFPILLAVRFCTTYRESRLSETYLEINRKPGKTSLTLSTVTRRNICRF